MFARLCHTLRIRTDYGNIYVFVNRRSSKKHSIRSECYRNIRDERTCVFSRNDPDHFQYFWHPFQFCIVTKITLCLNHSDTKLNDYNLFGSFVTRSLVRTREILKHGVRSTSSVVQEQNLPLSSVKLLFRFQFSWRMSNVLTFSICGENYDSHWFYLPKKGRLRVLIRALSVI